MSKINPVEYLVDMMEDFEDFDFEKTNPPFTEQLPPIVPEISDEELERIFHELKEYKRPNTVKFNPPEWMKKELDFIYVEENPNKNIKWE
jgi:hypothetical protein